MTAGGISSSLSKLGRAREHIGSLAAAEAAWLATDPVRWDIRVESDVDPADTAAGAAKNPSGHSRVQFTVEVGGLDPAMTLFEYRAASIEPPPTRLALIVGDVLTNLRASLDHLACQLVIAHGGAVTTRTSFPICEKPPKAALDVQGGVDAAALKVIESLQPYNTLGDVRLSNLNQLVNKDKHRSLVVTAAGGGEMNFAFADQVAKNYIDPGVVLTAGEIALQVHMTSAVLPADVSERPFDWVVPDVFVALALGEPGAERPLVRMLQELADKVDAVIGALTPYL